MAVLASLGHSTDDLGVMLLDATLLAVIVAPPIYWLVLMPLRREYEKRLAAESAAENLSKLAITDALTRIMNRRGITVALLDAMAQSERYSAPLCVAMADIDHFKPINDTYGHPAGDRVLTEIAGIFSDTLRMPDKVGRYGGEEFLIILPHTTLAGGRKIAERLRVAVSRWQFGIGRQETQDHRQPRHHPGAQGRGPGAVAGARRPGAIRGQERWPQPCRGAQGRLTATTAWTQEVE